MLSNQTHFSRVSRCNVHKAHSFWCPCNPQFLLLYQPVTLASGTVLSAAHCLYVLCWRPSCGGQSLLRLKNSINSANSWFTAKHILWSSHPVFHMPPAATTWASCLNDWICEIRLQINLSSVKLIVTYFISMIVLEGILGWWGTKKTPLKAAFFVLS